MPDDASPLLIELVRRYSPSEREAAAVRYLVDWLGAHGVDAREDEVGNAVGARGPEDAPHTLLLLGHIDTVPGEIPVRVENGALYGRGTVDAKGSLCAFAEATAQASARCARKPTAGARTPRATATSRTHASLESQAGPIASRLATRGTSGFATRCGAQLFTRPARSRAWAR